MTDKLKQFLEKVSGDEVLKAELDAALKGIEGTERIDAMIEFAKQKGIALKRADFTEKSEELNLEELESVTGGGSCECSVVGMGNDHDIDCFCCDPGSGIAQVSGRSFKACTCKENGMGSSRHR